MNFTHVADLDRNIICFLSAKEHCKLMGVCKSANKEYGINFNWQLFLENNNKETPSLLDNVNKKNKISIIPSPSISASLSNTDSNKEVFVVRLPEVKWNKDSILNVCLFLHDEKDYRERLWRTDLKVSVMGFIIEKAAGIKIPDSTLAPSKRTSWESPYLGKIISFITHTNGTSPVLKHLIKEHKAGLVKTTWGETRPGDLLFTDLWRMQHRHYPGRVTDVAIVIEPNLLFQTHRGLQSKTELIAFGNVTLNQYHREDKPFLVQEAFHEILSNSKSSEDFKMVASGKE